MAAVNCVIAVHCIEMKPANNQDGGGRRWDMTPVRIGTRRSSIMTYPNCIGLLFVRTVRFVSG